MTALLEPIPDATAVPFSSRNLPEQQTHNDTHERKPASEPGFSQDIVWTRRHTVCDIQSKERGRSDADRNIGEIAKRPRMGANGGIASSNGHAVRARSELAREIRIRVLDLIPLVGDVSFATSLQFLKRELSRGHEVLRSHPSETNFLSIITLIESSLSQLKWKDYSAAQLELIRDAADIGYQQLEVTFDDFDRIRQEFSDEAVDTRPRINLDSVSFDDLTDDEDK